MQNLEQQLYEIADKQGVNVNEIIMLVRENEDILEKQRNNLKVSKSYCGDLYILYFNIESLNHTLFLQCRHCHTKANICQRRGQGIHILQFHRPRPQN